MRYIRSLQVDNVSLYVVILLHVFLHVFYSTLLYHRIYFIFATRLRSNEKGERDRDEEKDGGQRGHVVCVSFLVDSVDCAVEQSNVANSPSSRTPLRSNDLLVFVCECRIWKVVRTGMLTRKFRNIRFLKSAL